MASNFPLTLTISAVDKATEPLRLINAKLKQFTAPVRRLNNSFKAFSAEAGIPRLMKSSLAAGHSIGRVAREAKSLGLKIGAMGAAAGVGLYAIIHGAMESGDKLGMMAQRVGLSVDAYAQLQYAAEQADVSQEDFSSSMDQFNKRLGEAKAGGGPLLQFLNKVAPALGQQLVAANNTEEALGLLTDAFERLEDPAKIAALSAAALGRSGLQMGQAMHRGRKVIAEQRSEFYKLAGSQEKYAETSDALDKASRKTKTSFLGIRGAVMGELFPALTALANAVTKVLGENRGGLIKWAQETGRAIRKWVDEGGVQKLVDLFVVWKNRIAWVVDKLGGLKNVLMVVGAIMVAPLVFAVVGLAGALWNLGAAVIPMLVRASMLLLPVLFKIGAAIAPLAVTIAPFVAAAVGLAAAGYAIYKNWSVLMEGFTTWTGYLNTFRTAIGMLVDPLESLRVAGQWWGKELGIGGTARPTLGAAAAAPGAAAAAAAAPAAPGAVAGPSQGSTHVIIDFNNAPKGARMTQAPGGTADVDLSMGYSMVPG